MPQASRPAGTEEDTMRIATLVLASALLAAGCADMSPTQQRAVTGTGIGAAGGAIIGAIAGNAGAGAAIGAGAGLVGGLLVDQNKNNQAAAYQSGYQSGRQNRPPAPPQ
jgi:hypothetical protein